MARPKKLDSLSLSELQGMIADRKNRVAVLRKEERKLQKKLEKVQAEIARAGGDASGRTRGIRPRNEMSLGDAIAEVLKSGKAMRVPDISEAVQDNGYKSSSPNFKAIVNQTLIKDERFHAPERGQYALVK